MNLWVWGVNWNLLENVNTNVNFACIQGHGHRVPTIVAYGVHGCCTPTIAAYGDTGAASPQPSHVGTRRAVSPPRLNILGGLENE